MNITIVGAGRVGVHLAKYFSYEHQNVYLVDSDSEKLSVLESDYNMRTFAGDPTEFQTLRDANADNADYFVALTADTSENLIACAIAKSMGAKRTIARVNRMDFINQTNKGLIQQIGVDNIVYPDLLAAKAIVSSINHPWCRSWNDFDNGKILLTAVCVNENAPIVGHQLKDLPSSNGMFHVSALRRNNATIIPRGTDYILAEDILYITAVPEGINRVIELTGKTDFPIKKVLIMGGSKVSELVARIIPSKYSLTIVEKNIERCHALTESCTECDIIYGDASEQEVLEESGIGKCDAFVALSDSTESNILACLTAKEAGVKRTIGEIEKEQFISKAEAFHIGTIINKPIITANAIFQMILDRNVDSSKCFAMTHAEVARLTIREGSYLTSAAIKDLSVPHGLTFAGMIRDGKGSIVNGATQFVPGDEVIVFCLNGSLAKVEKLFKK